MAGMSDIGRHFLHFGSVNDEYGEKPRVVVRTFSGMFERGKAAGGAPAASLRKPAITEDGCLFSA